MKRILSAIILMGLALSAQAQSKNFKLGKWIEIQNAILQELYVSYVDTLPVDRIERRAVDAMLEGLDPYTIYVPEEENENLLMMINKSYGGVGAVIYKPEKDGYVTINEPYEGSPAQKYNLRPGDQILEIDGQSVIGLETKDCSDRMRGEAGTVVRLKVQKLRGGIEDIDLVREKIHIPDMEYAGMLDDETGYISQTGFTEGVGDDIRNAVIRLKKQGMKKLVLDLRGNGGGLMVEAGKIVSIFVPKGSVVVTAHGKNPQSNYTLRTDRDPVDLKMPLTVLVDGSSASASEIVAGALQDYDRAAIIGTRTYGKGLIQSIRPLPYGGELKLTTAKYYTPSGRCVQAIDYSRRNEDGSVGHIPDSLTHEFKTAHGRTVRDGGGITPDVEIKSKTYSRIVYSIVGYGLAEQFALDFVRRHEVIAPVWDFHLSDEEFENFISFAEGKEFDYRTTARAMYDQMCKELEKDGLSDAMKPELEAMAKSLDMSKESFIRLKKDEIIPFLEEEIAVRYYFQEAGVKIRLRYDEQLHKALEAKVVLP